MVYQVRRAMRHAPRSARGAEPAALANEGDQFVVPAIGAARAHEAVRQNSAYDLRVELAFDELRQASASDRLSLAEEALGVLLHQAVQRSLLGAVALVMDRGAIAMHPVGLAVFGLHALGMESLGWCSFACRLAAASSIGTNAPCRGGHKEDLGKRGPEDYPSPVM